MIIHMWSGLKRLSVEVDYPLTPGKVRVDWGGGSAEADIQLDEGGNHYLDWNGERLDLESYMLYDLGMIQNMVSMGSLVKEVDLQFAILNEGVENVRFRVPCLLHSGEVDYAICKISEEANSVKQGYKLTLVPATPDPRFCGKEEFYLSDFSSLLTENKIQIWFPAAGRVKAALPFTLLTEPLTEKQIHDMADENGYVSGVIQVGIGDVIDNDHDEFLDMLSDRLVGASNLMDIRYEVVGMVDKGTIALKVTGDATFFLNEEPGEDDDEPAFQRYDRAEFTNAVIGWLGTEVVYKEILGCTEDELNRLIKDPSEKLESQLAEALAIKSVVQLNELAKRHELHCEIFE